MKSKVNTKLILFLTVAGFILIGLILVLKASPTFFSSLLSGTKQFSGPVTVYSCNEAITFDSVPQRALSFDTNMTEMMLALGLEDNMAGYWVSGVPVGEQYQDKIRNIPLVSSENWPPPSMEVVLSFDPDFVFGAWEYNFSAESGVTPEKLATAGVKSYILSESCIAVGVAPKETLESTYDDLINLGRIFRVEERAQEIVDQMRSDIASVQAKIGQVTPLRGLYYGGGAETAFTAGKFGMATKIMSAVGARNILADVEDDWIPSASWETIIERDPEFIMIDDTPWESAQKRIDTLESLPQLAGITAIREKRYIVFPWTYILPGMEMDDGIVLLAKALYPDTSF